MGFALGVVVGVVIAGIAAWLLMPRLMLTVRRSKASVEDTVAHIVDHAQREGWSVPKVYDLQQSIVQAGYELPHKVRIISLCKPPYARDVLGRDAFRRLAGIMPCRIGVYEGDDGGVYVAQMNTGLMGRMFGAFVGRIMGRVSEEEHRFTRGVLAEE